MSIRLDPLGPVRRRAQFTLERFLLGGSHYRLLFMVGLVGLISVTGGSIVHFFDSTISGDEPFSYWVWWAFLRLTDPGYLGDDDGSLKRTVSTAITVCGYVIFMGALIAIMTQWLNATIRRLEQGLTPVALRNHIVVLGWNERTPEILHELLTSEGRVQRFLRNLRARRLQIAVLAPDVDPELVAELRERLGRRYQPSRIILRSGSPLQIDHLRRVDYARAAVLILLGGDQHAGSSADQDARTIKCMLTVRHYGQVDAPDGLPHLVAAVKDRQVMDIALAAYPAGRAQIIAGDALVGRMMAQTIRHPGLSYILDELLSEGEGSELYLRTFPEFVGQSVRSVAHAFDDGVVIGVLGGQTGSLPVLNPDATVAIQAGDRLVLLAEDYEVNRARSMRVAGPIASVPAPALAAANNWRVLILGWNHTVPALLTELDSHCHSNQQLRVDLMSAISISTRVRRLEQIGLAQPQMQLNHLEGDYAVPSDVLSLDLSQYNSILIVGSDRLETAGDADARTLLGHHLVSAGLSEVASPPQVFVELRDPTNATLFDDAVTEVLATGEVLSHVAAQVALRPDLQVVFDQLLGPGGPEIVFRSVADYTGGVAITNFGDLIDAAAAHGETALGIRRASVAANGGVRLNPPRNEALNLGPDDALIVMTTR